MKFKDKLLQDHPEFRNKITVEYGCPKDYGYEKMDYTEVCLSGCDCDVCWNREMPDTEIKEDAYKEDMNTAYNKGLNDGRNEVWEFLDRIEHAIKSSVLIEVFGYSNIGDILDHFKPQEALAKLKEYEDSKIEVGDVVTEGNRTFIVTHISCDCVFGLLPDGDLYSVPKISDCKKTGKHIDIKAILDQIKE